MRSGHAFCARALRRKLCAPAQSGQIKQMQSESGAMAKEMAELRRTLAEVTAQARERLRHTIALI